jgi:polysaccharide export outer membrane protein
MTGTIPATFHHHDGGGHPALPPPGATPTELSKVSMPPYVIEPPDILLVESTVGLKEDQPIRGEHLVRPDGTINLGIYGPVHVAGKTLEQAKTAIVDQLRKRIQGAKDPKTDKIVPLQPRDINVDVLAYNSKKYYVITDGGGYGEQVFPIPFTGSETVLDALAHINGLPAVASKKHIWVARRSPAYANQPQILPVDWIGITQHGFTTTNYQLLPGDRVYVRADKWIHVDSGLAKRLSPLERILGITLLGSQTVNSIERRGTFSGQ